MEPKARTTSSKSGKSERVGGGTSSGPVTAPSAVTAPGTEKKESAPKEAPVPVAKKTPGATEVTPGTNSNLTKPASVETGSQEISSASPELDGKGNGPDGESTSGFFENMKPLIFAGGVAVAAIAVILGVVFFARKK